MTRTSYDRNAATIERLAKEVLEQVGHYRRNTANGHDDRLRFVHIENRAWEMLRVAGYAVRRYDKEHEAKR